MSEFLNTKQIKQQYNVSRERVRQVIDDAVRNGGMTEGVDYQRIETAGGKHRLYLHPSVAEQLWSARANNPGSPVWHYPSEENKHEQEKTS